jgi:hypothetical protein
MKQLAGHVLMLKQVVHAATSKAVTVYACIRERNISHEVVARVSYDMQSHSWYANVSVITCFLDRTTVIGSLELHFSGNTFKL